MTDYELINYINNIKNQGFQFPESNLRALNYDGTLIKYMDQTIECCLVAVKQNGLAIRFIQNPTHEVCESAINQNPLALQFIENQTNELCMLAVKKNGLALKFVEIMKSDIAYTAVKQNYEAMKYAYIFSPAFIKTIIPTFGLALEFLPAQYQTNELCMSAVKNNGMALEFVHTKTKEIIEEALKSNPEVVQFVNLDKTNTK